MAVNTLEPTVEKTLSDLDQIINDAPEDLAQRIREATNYLRTDYIEQFSMIQDQVEEVQTYTKRIADAQKGSVTDPQMEPNDINALISRQIKLIDHIAKRKNITVEPDLGDVPVFSFDRFLVETAIYNLINNAIPETPEESSVSAAGPEVQAFQAPVFHRSLNSNHQFQSRRSPVAVQE